MTFSDAYASVGPDVEAIAKLLGISPPQADRLINEEMNRRHTEVLPWAEENAAKLNRLVEALA